MITSFVLAFRFLMGIGTRLRRDDYFRSLGILVLVVLLIGSLVPWLVAGWGILDSILYATTTMSMNTPYGGPRLSAADATMKCFHMAYTFLSVGAFIIFAIETGKTMLATYEQFVEKRRARKAQRESQGAS